MALNRFDLDQVVNPISDSEQARKQAELDELLQLGGMLRERKSQIVYFDDEGNIISEQEALGLTEEEWATYKLDQTLNRLGSV